MTLLLLTRLLIGIFGHWLAFRGSYRDAEVRHHIHDAPQKSGWMFSDQKDSIQQAYRYWDSIFILKGDRKPS